MVNVSDRRVLVSVHFSPAVLRSAGRGGRQLSLKLNSAGGFEEMGVGSEQQGGQIWES